jgi:large subunit ribosomal protein L23
MPYKGLIRKPHITEKAGMLKSENKYVFEVDLKANKSEIKKSLERAHKVNVISVNTVRLGRKKKAIVALKEGQSINEKV